MVNYHNHTALCGHSRGEMSEYGEKAIEKGIGEFGFSDHAAMPDDIRQGVSMGSSEMEGYVESVMKCREDFAGRIDIKVGFEVDFPPFNTFDIAYFTDPRIDFIIGSCHFLGDWPFDHPDYIERFDEKDINEIYRDYYSLIEIMVESRNYDIIGHFDLLKKFGHYPTDNMDKVIIRICKKMAAFGIVAEINTAGLQKPVGEIYPGDHIIDLFFQENVPVTLGSDSHSPDDVGYGYSTAIAKLKSAGYRKVSGFEKRVRHEVFL